MPKPAPVETFRVTTIVPTDGLGATIAALTKLGHTEINFDLVTNVPAFARNARSETTSVEYITGWIKDHPTFMAKEVVSAAKAAGRSGGAIYPALATLVGNGVLKQLGSGMYARADMKALAAPETKTKSKPKPKTFSKPGEDVIVSYARRNHGRFNTAKLVEIFEKEKRGKGSVYSSIDRLLKDKRVKRVGDKGSGQYVLIANGNGAAPAEVTEVAANG